uniref:Uncharacterized protein n=1 Tax=Sphaerodactylus townsendi TaxID=933632 RepID=A0ACB8G983_9SAUR
MYLGEMCAHCPPPKFQSTKGHSRTLRGFEVPLLPHPALSTYMSPTHSSGGGRALPKKLLGLVVGVTLLLLLPPVQQPCSGSANGGYSFIPLLSPAASTAVIGCRIKCSIIHT